MYIDTCALQVDYKLIRTCMGKITIVSVTNENVAISIKIVLPYFS